MSMTRSVCLCLIFLNFLTSPLVLCSRNPRMVAPTAAMDKNIMKEQIHAPALFVSAPSKVDSSAPLSMVKIDNEPATNSAISGFFRYTFPFQGWPFHKYSPFPMAKPLNPVPTNPATGADEEETEKVPSSPTKGTRDGDNRDGGNRDGGNA